MAGQGPHSKPTALKILHGNPGKRAINHLEPKVKQDKAPACPKHVKGVAKKEWNRISNTLFDMGVLTDADTTVLSGYCMLYARWVQIEKELAKSKILMIKHTVDSYGNEHIEAKPNPLVNMARQTLHEIRLFCSEFGLTPSSRAKLQVPGQSDEDPEEAFLRKGKGGG